MTLVSRGGTKRYSSKKYRLKAGPWNDRTFLDRKESSNLEHRTDMIAKKLTRYDIHIAAFSEIRSSRENQLTEYGVSYNFFWKLNPKGE